MIEDPTDLNFRKDRYFSGRKSIRFNVRPRYSAGSPAQVSEDIALQVAKDERTDYERALEGVYGEEQKKRAETLGLSGIVYAMKEEGSGRKFRWHVWDLITDEESRRLHDNEIYRLGFTRFEHLPATIQKRLVPDGCRYPDLSREFFKVSNYGETEQYKPEIVRGL